MARARTTRPLVLNWAGRGAFTYEIMPSSFWKYAITVDEMFIPPHSRVSLAQVLRLSKNLKVFNIYLFSLLGF